MFRKNVYVNAEPRLFLLLTFEVLQSILLVPLLLFSSFLFGFKMGEGKLVIQRSENGLYILVIMSLLSTASWFCDRLFFEHCTWLTGGIACIVLATILAAIASFLQQKKIQRLGATAPVVSYWAPLGRKLHHRSLVYTTILTKYAGLDLVFKSTSALVSHQFFPFVRDLLIRHGRTAELHMMGVRVILTDEAENVRAILMNQVYSIPSL